MLHVGTPSIPENRSPNVPRNMTLARKGWGTIFRTFPILREISLPEIEGERRKFTFRRDRRKIRPGFPCLEQRFLIPARTNGSSL